MEALVAGVGASMLRSTRWCEHEALVRPHLPLPPPPIPQVLHLLASCHTYHLCHPTALCAVFHLWSYQQAVRAAWAVLHASKSLRLTCHVRALCAVEPLRNLCSLPPCLCVLPLRYMKEQLAASARATTVAEECFSNLRTVRHPHPA